MTWKNSLEYTRVLFRYYKNKRFRQIDFYLLRHYILQNPYQISKEFENLHAYGETPLTTLEKIAKECAINSEDFVFELGSGRGRTCFWLNCFCSCRVIGVEYNPVFVEIASKVAEKFEVRHVSFRCADYLDIDLSDASVVYFYGTTADDVVIQKLIKKLKQCHEGTRIVTVSYPLSDYTTEPLFSLEKKFKGEFTWGEAEVFIQRKLQNSG